MKISRFFPLLLLTLTCIGAAAQTTGLFTYDGGYFVKAGDYWTEYRPGNTARPTKTACGRHTLNTAKKRITIR